MRALVQRVRWAKVTVEQQVVGQISAGLLALVGLRQQDTEEDLNYIARKVIGLRVFADDAGQMNCDLSQVGGQLLLVSQFTLYGDCRKGRRPSFVQAMAPEPAEAMFDRFVAICRQQVPVTTGRFGAMMDVELCNDGPVTLLIDSAR